MHREGQRRRGRVNDSRRVKKLVCVRWRGVVGAGRVQEVHREVCRGRW